MLLSYPLGDALNISQDVTRADAELFIPITCKENAGMTTPIHTNTLLMLGEEALAQGEFNRSMRAACYGAFNVSNEVDKHPNVQGAHYDNSHFLTGGGFLQALLYGYAGMRVTESGVKLRPPALPEEVGRLAFASLQWRGVAFMASVNASALVLASAASVASVEAGSALCVVDGRGVSQRLPRAGTGELALDRDKFAWPGLVISC